MSNNLNEQVSKTVESAKDTMEKFGEQVTDFFQGNPFSTPVGKKIEMATDSNALATENWGLNMEICDFINNTEEGPKDAVRAIRKRLHTNMAKNNSVVMYTLTVLETCVKNCDRRFHVLICNKDFVQDLVKLIGPKFDAPQIVQERVLSLIQAWADAFKNQPDLQGVVQSYNDLKAKGVEFPAADLDSLAPIITPKRTVFTEPQSPPTPAGQSTNPSAVVANLGPGPIQATPEQLTKLRSDLDVVNSNIKVLSEMLAEISPGKETADELQLLQELHATCRQMQQRVVALVPYIANSEVTYELIMANDNFNAVFEKYDRFMQRRVEGPAAGGNEQGAPAAAAPAADLMSFDEGKSLQDQLHALNVSGGAASSSAAGNSHESYKANSEQQAGIPDASEAKAMEEWLAAQGETPEKPKTKDDLDNEKL
ncbi:hypothetical protein WR25_11894 [Diploscapter pachys]|uniref:VHS domain-containing protein n=1 Tax=Diploscapter pachys TaxID=2018661 RepID=A0A2A2JB39_9BILA|nr:hypothetical protein WR25_11894 [Diploscapter pachys]